MLVEDEPSLCHFLGEVLAAEYVLEIAPDGEQAWLAIEQKQPDVVLANVNMPVLDGLALVRRMRGSAATASVPVLLLSARVGSSVSREGLAAGANGWLQKPFRVRELLSTLRTLSPPVERGLT